MWGNRTEFAIGIDAGTKTGYAQWDPKQKILVEVKTMKIHEALERVLQLHRAHKIKVYIEDARKSVKPPRTQAEMRQAMAKAQGVGSIKRDAVIWQDFLEGHQIPHEMVKPNHQLTKLSVPIFQKMTKYTGLTSNHGRDAAMVVYGR